MAANIKRFVRRREAVQGREWHLEVERFFRANDQSIQHVQILILRFHRLAQSFSAEKENGEETGEEEGEWRNLWIIYFSTGNCAAFHA